MEQDLLALDLNRVVQEDDAFNTGIGVSIEVHQGEEMVGY